MKDEKFDVKVIKNIAMHTIVYMILRSNKCTQQKCTQLNSLDLRFIILHNMGNNLKLQSNNNLFITYSKWNCIIIYYFTFMIYTFHSFYFKAYELRCNTRVT